MWWVQHLKCHLLPSAGALQFWLSYCRFVALSWGEFGHWELCSIISWLPCHHQPVFHLYPQTSGSEVRVSEMFPTGNWRNSGEIWGRVIYCPTVCGKTRNIYLCSSSEDDNGEEEGGNVFCQDRITTAQSTQIRQGYSFRWFSPLAGLKWQKPRMLYYQQNGSLLAYRDCYCCLSYAAMTYVWPLNLNAIKYIWWWMKEQKRNNLLYGHNIYLKQRISSN